MIIANGTIETATKTDGGYDESTGRNKPATITWSSPIPCQYSANNFSFKGKSNGESFISANYLILIEGDDFNCETIRLYNERGTLIGKFEVVQIEPLQAVGQVRIIV